MVSGAVGAEALAADLSGALARDELRVHYLPTLNLSDGLVSGVEALARWQRGDELLAAQEYLPVAERTGLLVEIGRWVMRRACEEVARWNERNTDRPALRLAVNVSLRQLTEPDAIAHLRGLLHETALDPTLLTLEVSEDSLHLLGHAAGPTLLALNGIGVRFSVDDFGTGASSLVALQRYPLDELKIDRSFVAQMDEDADAAGIVRGVVRLAQSLGLRTVAEGVERPGQEQMLRALRCDAAQGWLYAKPAADLADAIAVATRSATASLERMPVEHRELWEGMPNPLAAARFVEAVFESAPIGMALVDDTGRHVAANPAAAELLATDVGSLLERTCWELVHPEDLQADLAGMDDLMDGTRSRYTVEERILGSDGSPPRWVEVTVCGVPGDHHANGAPVRVLRQIRSIEGRRRAGEATTVLRSVIAATPDPLIILDRQGRCTHWNSAAEALFGWSEEDMVGSALTRLVDVASRLPLARALGDAAAGTAVRWSDAIWVSSSGEPRAVDVTVGPIIDESDRRIGLVALARDVSEQREAATALSRAHEALGLHAAELAAANLRLASFAGTLAHDLMQPLAAVDGFLSLLDREAMELADDHRDWLTTAIRGKDRLRVAIESLYRNATASELDLVAVDLAGVVAEIVEEMVPQLGDAEVLVGDLPIVEGDRGFVVQVFANLLQNANRYRHDERPLVISVESWTEGTSPVVSVSDSGKGISTDELERVFSPGERGRSATGTEGTGTGLATVRTLMHRMGGEVWAEPVPSGGVRMCLRFSAAVAPALDVPA